MLKPSITDLRSLVERRWHGTVARVGAALLPGIPTGDAGLDAALGDHGIPRGKLTELFGAPSSGKTTLAFAMLAACTRAGDIAAFVDLPHAFFAPAAAAAGIDLLRLLVVQPPNAASARQAVDALVRGGACALVALDCAERRDVLRAHHCTRLAAQAEKTGTAFVVVSEGDSAAVASFASVRLRAEGLAPSWQTGSAGSGRLAGCTVSVAVAKSRTAAPGKRVRVAAFVPDVAGTFFAEPAELPPAPFHLDETDGRHDRSFVTA
ncbi:MAG: hypothetical protein JO104_07030 [Candidatus Eremiobacteraeota bacterium]|nr:hypothetical protein [Candidatus Eremiobacteraeota bacterium]